MKIHSIFKSINGEVCRGHQGSLTTFVRTFGCNAKPHCSYCDTKYSYGYNPFREMRVRDIVGEVKKLGCKNVTITGGEPLIQKGTIKLIADLALNGYDISIETNGTKYIPYISPKVSWVADYKLPSSGCEKQMNPENYQNLCPGDFIKFVISDRNDFDRAIQVIQSMSEWLWLLFDPPQFAFSPVWGSLKPETLAEWMIDNEYLCKIGAIYSLQIHKILKVL